MQATPTVPPLADTTKNPENIVQRRRASDWTKPATLVEHPDSSATLSRERLSVCLNATYELEALANIMPGLVPDIVEAEGAHYAVRGIADRIRRLSHVLMAGLGDEVETVKNLERKVFGTAQREAA